MNIKTILITLVCSLSTLVINAQHDEYSVAQSHEKEHQHGKHKISLYGGFTHVDAAFYEHETSEESIGKWIPTLGLDYYYTLNDKFDIGFIGDIELDSYFIKHKEGQRDLERANVLVLTPVVKYKLMHTFGIVLGGGVEVEFASEVKYLGVMKVALEYEVPIANGWELTPSIAYDYKKEYSTVALGMSLGKRF